MKIIIPTISNYYGGTLMLSVLCKILRELGYEATLLIIPYFPKKKVSKLRFTIDCIIHNFKYLITSYIKDFVAKITPNAAFVKYYKTSANILKVEGIKIRRLPWFRRNRDVLICSEDIYGNPFGAKHVVRWLLYHYDYKHDIDAYSKHDLFIAYKDVFNDLSLNPNNYIVTINYFDKLLYRQYNFKERIGVCYIIHKGYNRTDLPKKYDGPIFSSEMSHEELVDMLNTYKFCICYDPQTFYMTIAVVCGCIPILIPEKGKTTEDYFSKTENHYGIAYGNSKEQINYAINTRDQCLDSLDYSSQNIKNVRTLVAIIEKHFGNVDKIKNVSKIKIMKK